MFQANTLTSGFFLWARPPTWLTSRGLGRYCISCCCFLLDDIRYLSLAAHVMHVSFLGHYKPNAPPELLVLRLPSPSLLRECLVMFFEDVWKAASRVVNIVDPPSVEQIVFYVCTYRKCIRGEKHAVRLSAVPNQA